MDEWQDEEMPFSEADDYTAANNMGNSDAGSAAPTTEGVDSLSAEEIEALRRRRTVSAEREATEKAEHRAARERRKVEEENLRAEQRAAEAKRVQEGNGAPSVSESVRSIAGVFASLSQLFSKIIKGILNLPAEIVAVGAGVLVGIALLFCFGGGAFSGISGAAESLAGTVSSLWSKYITEPAEHNANHEPTVITELSLIQAVDVGRLTDASAQYKGLAVKTDEDGKETCHIYYETVFFSYVETSEIGFEIDESSKTVKMILPEQHVEAETPAMSSIDYFESNVGSSSLEDDLELCKADAKAKAASNETLLEYGKENLKRTIKVLLAPVLEGSGYTLV